MINCDDCKTTNMGLSKKKLSWHLEQLSIISVRSKCHVFYPPTFAEASAGRVGKVGDAARRSRFIGDLLCCQGFAVLAHRFTLSVAELQHPRHLQRWGLFEKWIVIPINWHYIRYRDINLQFHPNKESEHVYNNSYNRPDLS